MTPEERTALEENILADGRILEPIVVWKGKEVIVDGHHRWEIYLDHFDVLPYPPIEEKEFEDLEAALRWSYKHQRGRRSTTPEQESAARARLFNFLKRPKEDNLRQPGEDETGLEEDAVNAGKLVAEISGVSLRTITRDAEKLEQVDKLAPELRDLYLAGKAKTDIDGLKKLASKTKREQEILADRLRKGKIKGVQEALDKPLRPVKKPISKGVSVAEMENHFGCLARGLDRRSEVRGGEGVYHQRCVATLKEAYDAWTLWRKAPADAR